jgi:hypothetical protein
MLENHLFGSPLKWKGCVVGFYTAKEIKTPSATVQGNISPRVEAEARQNGRHDIKSCKHKRMVGLFYQIFWQYDIVFST